MGRPCAATYNSRIRIGSGCVRNTRARARQEGGVDRRHPGQRPFRIGELLSAQAEAKHAIHASRTTVPTIPGFRGTRAAEPPARSARLPARRRGPLAPTDRHGPRRRGDPPRVGPVDRGRSRTTASSPGRLRRGLGRHRRPGRQRRGPDAARRPPGLRLRLGRRVRLGDGDPEGLPAVRGPRPRAQGAPRPRPRSPPPRTGCWSHYLPAQAPTILDPAYATSLAGIPDGQAKTDGVALGERVAAAWIAKRANDGFRAPATYTPPDPPIPGVWIPTAATPPIGAYARRHAAVHPPVRPPVPARRPSAPRQPRGGPATTTRPRTSAAARARPAPPTRPWPRGSGPSRRSRRRAARSASSSWTTTWTSSRRRASWRWSR